MDLGAIPSKSLYQLIVTRNGGRDVLLSRLENGYTLPAVEVRSEERLVAALTSEARLRWGCDTLYLFSGPCTPTGSNRRNQYCVLEQAGMTKARLRGADWAGTAELSVEHFRRVPDYDTIQQALAEWKRHSRSPLGPFARPGWWDSLSQWFDEVIQSRGLRIQGVRQLNGGPRFVLLRIESTARAFWFKAVGEPNIREFRITVCLSDCGLPHVPQVVATLPEYSGWLSSEALGIDLENGDLSSWMAAAAALAELQISSLEHLDNIQGAGVHTLCMGALRDASTSCLEQVLQAMQWQTTLSPPPLTSRQIADLREQLALAFSMISDLSVPDSVGHLDLNPANIIVSPSECTFLDWCEAYVGNPFFSFEYLSEHFRRRNGAASSQLKTLEEAYWSRWRPVLPSGAVEIAQQVTPLLAAYAYAVVMLKDTNRNTPDCGQRQALLRTLGRRMKREAERLWERRSLCPVS